MNPVLPADYLTLLLLALAGVAGWLAWASSAELGLRARCAVVGLRLLAVAGAGLIAFNPGRWLTERETGEPRWAVLVDGSRSMAAPVGDATRGAGDAVPRWERAAEVAARLAAVEGPARVDFFRFGARPAAVDRLPADDLARLEPDGGASDISGAVGAVLDRYGAGENLLGLILLSDGREVGGRPGEPAALRARARDVPLHALPLGGAVARRDLVLTSGRQRHTAFLGQTVSLGAEVANQNLGPLQVKVELLDPGGVALEARTVELAGGEKAALAFSVEASEVGHTAYTIATAVQPGEQVATNNAAAAGLTVLDGAIRLLVVEGTPHWDTKFLVQHLRGERFLQPTTVSRIAAERFYRIEPAGEATGEPTEIPVFPDSAEELASYDVVLLGQGVEYFITPARAELLERFVRDAGGALIFARGKPYSGALPALEPLEPLEWGAPAGGSLRWHPTAAGARSRLFGGALPGLDDPLWERLPPVAGVRLSPRLKPFAQVLVEGRTAAAKAGGPPVLISRRLGRGILLAVNAEGLWQWDFFPVVPESSAFYREFWVQAVQWAITYSEFLPGQRYALRVEKGSILPGDPVRAFVSARDAGARAPNLRVERSRDRAEAGAGDTAGEGRTTVHLAPTPGGAGWEAAFTLAEPGLYQLSVEAGEEGGAGPAGGVSPPTTTAATAQIEVRRPPSEEDELSADTNFLRALANGSGGELIDAERALALVREPKPKARNAAAPAFWDPAWDVGPALLFIVALCAAEWFIRRRNGLL